MNLQKKESKDKPKRTFKEFIRHAFSVNGGKGLTEEELDVLDRLAGWIYKKNLVTPSIFFLESLSPLNFIGSQVMIFFKPLLGNVLSAKDYDLLQTALEKRESLHILVDKIVEKDHELALKRSLESEKK